MIRGRMDNRGVLICHIGILHERAVCCFCFVLLLNIKMESETGDLCVLQKLGVFSS